MHRLVAAGRGGPSADGQGVGVALRHAARVRAACKQVAAVWVAAWRLKAPLSSQLTRTTNALNQGSAAGRAEPHSDRLLNCRAAFQWLAPFCPRWAGCSPGGEDSGATWRRARIYNAASRDNLFHNGLTKYRLGTMVKTTNSETSLRTTLRRNGRAPLVETVVPSFAR